MTNKTSPTQALLPPQLDMSRQMVKGLAERTWQQVRIVSQDTLESIDRVVNDLARMPGSRMLLLVSSGFLAGTLEREQDQVINRALRTGVVINALDAKGLYAEAPVRPLDEPLNGEMGIPDSTFRFEVSSSLDRLWAVTEAMANFAQSTGGLFFHNDNDLAFGFRELAAVPEVSYILTFRPDDAAATGRYHKLRVRLAFSNPYSIEARPGYFALPRDSATPADWRSRLDQQVKGEEPVQEFPVTLTVESRKLAGGSAVFTARIHVDMKTLRFPPDSYPLHAVGRREGRAAVNPTGGKTAGATSTPCVPVRTDSFVWRRLSRLVHFYVAHPLSALSSVGLTNGWN